MRIIILIILFAVPFLSKGQTVCQVKFYLDVSGNQVIGGELDPVKTHLDSLIVKSEDIVWIDEINLIFYLTKNAADKLRKMQLDFKCFTLVINGTPVLAGWFWGCYSSLGTTGYVSFNLNCGDQNQDKLHITYSLPPEDLPNDDLIKRSCSNKTNKP